MRQVVKEFVKICSECFDFSEPVYEFGSLQVPGQEDFANLRALFKDKKYIGSDYRPGLGVDTVLNLHNIELPSVSAGSVLCLETLEHVEFPWKAVGEIHRILVPQGILVVSSVMNFPIHAYPYDYWRFTPEGFRSLLSSFKHSIIEPIGKKNFPEEVIAIAFKSEVDQRSMERFQARLAPWRNYWNDPFFRGLKRVVRPISPKKIIELYRRMRNTK